MQFTNRTFSLIAGISYLVIFFAAIYANFFALELIIQDPLNAVSSNGLSIRLGIMAFLIAAIFDVFVAWTLYEIYKDNILTIISTWFRIIHAVIMAIAVFTLPAIFSLQTEIEILNNVETFNTIWLIGLLFFGVHLILLSKITKEIKYIPTLLALAGAMYILDTSAHFLMPNYEMYASTFLALVAIPSILGEMSFTIWLLTKGGKN